MKGEFREHFEYLRNGIFRRRTRGGNWPSGSLVRGSLHHSGYLVFEFKRRQWRYHRAIYIWHYGEPDGVVDHINGDPMDNRIENLRDATASQNCHNSKTPITNVSGVKGLRFLKKKKLWRGVVRKNSKMFYVHSAKFETARAKLNNLRKRLHGEFARP